MPSITIDVDVDEPVNTAALSTLKSYSYYLENIFNLEDLYLYRGVVWFYLQNYSSAIDDFHKSQLISTASSSEHSKDKESLKLYTTQSRSMASEKTNKTDLSDVGLSSQNENECHYNMLICYMMLKDTDNILKYLQLLTSKTPSKYSHNVLLLRAIVYE